MRNRIPTPGQEGRVLVTPENGSPSFYAKLSMADNPIEQGTPFATATMLTDETAALFGLTGDAVPNAVLAFLGKYNQHWWRRRKYEKAIVVDDEIQLRIYYDTSNNDMVELTYSNSYTYNLTNGTVSLASPVSTVTYSSFYANRLDPVLGKYFKYNNVIYLAGDSYSVGEDVTEHEYIYIKAKKVHIDYPESEWEFVRAESATGYPVGISNGYLYEYLSVPFSNAVTAPKAVLGSYIGTGMAGADNPTMLVFDSIPKALFLSEVDNLYFHFKDPGKPNYYMMINGVTNAFVDQSSSNSTSTPLVIAWEGNTVSWYHNPNTQYYVPYAAAQFNALNKKYLYLAIL